MDTKYRFRNGDAISAWLTASGLRDAVKSKQLRPESQIQKAGREDWVLASSVPDLFPPEPPPAPAKEEEPARTDARPGMRPAETIHHLLHRCARASMLLRAADSPAHRASPLEATLLGVSADCFLIELAEPGAVVYVPLARIRSVTIASKFPAQGPPRRGEVLVVDIDALPDLAELAIASAP